MGVLISSAFVPLGIRADRGQGCLARPETRTRLKQGHPWRADRIIYTDIGSRSAGAYRTRQHVPSGQASSSRGRLLLADKTQSLRRFDLECHGDLKGLTDAENANTRLISQPTFRRLA